MNTTWNPNQKTLSNKTAKVGAAAGLTASAAYLFKNRDDIFAKNIRNVKKMTVDYVARRFPESAKEIGAENLLATIVKKTKIRTVTIPLAAATIVIAGAALVGKTIGLVAEKIQEKMEIHKIGKMIDKNAAEALAELNKPIDYEKIDKSLEPIVDAEELATLMAEAQGEQEPSFKGSETLMPFYIDLVPDVATIDFLKEFDRVRPVSTSAQKSTFSEDDVIRRSDYNVPFYFDSPKEEMAPIGYK